MEEDKNIEEFLEDKINEIKIKKTARLWSKINNFENIDEGIDNFNSIIKKYLNNETNLEEDDKIEKNFKKLIEQCKEDILEIGIEEKNDIFLDIKTIDLIKEIYYIKNLKNKNSKNKDIFIYFLVTSLIKIIKFLFNKIINKKINIINDDVIEKKIDNYFSKEAQKINNLIVLNQEKIINKKINDLVQNNINVYNNKINENIELIYNWIKIKENEIEKIKNNNISILNIYNKINENINKNKININENKNNIIEIKENLKIIEENHKILELIIKNYDKYIKDDIDIKNIQNEINFIKEKMNFFVKKKEN